MEDIILVDIDDNEIGYASKTDVHEKGMLHRAFSIFIINEDKILIQKRAINKYHSGGLWTNACCSHPRKGEKIQDAVHRRLIEEMGFDCKLEEQFYFTYRTVFSDKLFEYEIDHVFLGKYTGDIVLNKEEASEVKWVEIKKLKNELTNHPEKFTEWFIIAAPQIISIMEAENAG